MFADQKIKVTDLGKILPNLSPTGVASVGKYLGFSTGVLKALEKRNLVDVVLSELEKRHPDDECMLRSYKDVPVGVPTGIDADGINYHLATKYFDSGKLLAPFTMLEYTRATQGDLEFLPNDVFKINYTGWADLLNGRVTNTIELLRMICTNRAVVREKAFTKKCSIKDFDPKFAKFEELRDEFVPKLQKYVESMNNEKATVSTLGQLTAVANEINSESLKLDMKERALLSLDVYEVPRSLKKKGEGDYNPLTFPETWKKTALIDDTVYSLWNTATREITQRQNNKVLTPEKALKAHVMTGGLLRLFGGQQEAEVIVAERKKKRFS